MLSKCLAIFELHLKFFIAFWVELSHWIGGETNWSSKCPNLDRWKRRWTITWCHQTWINKILPIVVDIMIWENNIHFEIQWHNQNNKTPLHPNKKTYMYYIIIYTTTWINTMLNICTPTKPSHPKTPTRCWKFGLQALIDVQSKCTNLQSAMLTNIMPYPY